MIAAIGDRPGLAAGHLCYRVGAGLIPQMVLRVVQAKRLLLSSPRVVAYQHRKKMCLQFRIIIADSDDRVPAIGDSSAYSGKTARTHAKADDFPMSQVGYDFSERCH